MKVALNNIDNRDLVQTERLCVVLMDDALRQLKVGLIDLTQKEHNRASLLGARSACGAVPRLREERGANESSGRAENVELLVDRGAG